MTDTKKFVIHKHDASSLHYDLRLEVDDTGKSWAIPKGPSTDPSEKRLAIKVDDHDLDYLDFEGVIPEGEEGAGPVMVWDKGTYLNLYEEKDMKQAIDDGKVKIELKGEKLHGGYTLINTGKRWLFIKIDDNEADARRNPTNTEPKSVKTGRTLEEIEESGNKK